MEVGSARRCREMSPCFQISTSSLVRSGNELYDIAFPNPANDVVNVKVSTESGVVEIYSIQGKLMIFHEYRTPGIITNFS